MRVLLCTLNSKFIHSNLALRYLRAAISNSFPDHQLLEFQINDDLRRVTAEIGRRHPDVITFSCYIWNIALILPLIADLKKVLPHAIIIVGGPEAGPRTAELLQEHEAIDYVIQGEGEGALPRLLTCLQEGQAKPSIPGVYYRGDDGKCTGTPRSEALPADQIPAPYQAHQLAELEHKLVYYETSRGCPFKCTYCLSGGEKVRFLPLSRVYEDLSLLLAADIPLIKFVDRTFNCQPARAQAIMKFLLENRRHSRFHFEICADLLDDSFIEWLNTVPKDVFQFEIGVQSLNPATLAAIERHMQWDKLAANVKKLRQPNNIHLHLDLIAGLPYQDWDALRYSFDQVIRLRPHMLQLGFLKVLPGTKMAQQVEQHAFQVSTLPPYEVLSSPWLSFTELNRLHVMEQLLNNYYNSGLLAYSLPYIWQEIEPSPFDFFAKLAKTWQSEGLHMLAHSQETLFTYMENYLKPSGLLQDLLDIDRARMLPSFPAHYRLPAEYRSAWESYLVEELPAFAPRTYRQAFRSVYPLWLQEDTLRYLEQDSTVNAAIIDREKKDIHGFTNLEG